MTGTGRTYCNRLIATVITLLAMVMPILAVADEVKLITSASQLSTNANANGLDYLLDGNAATAWSSRTAAGNAAPAENHYLQASFSSPLTGTIYIYLRRPASTAVGNPTAFRIEGKNAADASWTNVCTVNVPYRVSLYDEYSAPIALPDAGYSMLRFTVVDNSWTADDNGRDSGYMFMTLAEFQLVSYTTTSSGWIDPWHLANDFQTTYYDWAFETTNGVRKNTRAIDTNGWRDALLLLWDDNCNFRRAAQEGDLLAAAGIELPKMGFFTSADDRRIVEGMRQATHVQEHTLYAIPGDAVLMYPFSDITTATGYKQNYVRWYDYKTNKDNGYIDFLTNPKSIQRTKNMGFLGSTIFTGTAKADGTVTGTGAMKTGTVATFLYPPCEEWPQGSNGEFYIAADFSQTCRMNNGYCIHITDKHIQEPVITFRHVFTIKDGREQARQLSATASDNREYIARHRRRVSARAGKDFQIRLDHPVPRINGLSQLYYMTADGVYRRLSSCDVETYDGQTGQRVGDIFKFLAPYSGEGSRTANGKTYSWFDADKSFYRAVGCDGASVAEARQYVVKLFAKDENGNRLLTADGAADIQVAEYVVDFMPDEAASFVNEEELAKSKYLTHRSAYLDEVIGAPKTTVNYDQYRALESLSVKSDSEDKTGYNGNPYIYSTDLAGDLMARRYRWPSPWDNSNYGFGYDNQQDFNMYCIANHSSVTPYKSAAQQYPAEKNFGKATGLFDRLFYDTEGEQQGYFYYANAASDPGLMATLDIDDLCSSSTIYVSAWVAEFSCNYNETANVIFNFNAKLKKDCDKIAELGENVTLHSFVTGYVEFADGETLIANGKSSVELQDRGRWMHVYYSFVPNFKSLGITAGDIDYYQLTLENNCLSSQGADYAIDDIRLYVAKPRIYAEQQTPLCDATERSTQVQVEIPFDILLASIGENEASSAATAVTNKVFYTILDKKAYDDAYTGDADSYRTAFSNAIIRYEYMAGLGAEQPYGWFAFSNYYDSNGDMRQTVDGERMIAFTTQPTDDDLRVGKLYDIVMYMSLDNEDVLNEEDLPTCFDLNDPCVKMCTLRVKGSSVVKIDGVPVEDPDNIWACTDQMPVVQLDLYGRPVDGTSLVLIKENAYYDWYVGTNEQYGLEERDGTTLSKTLAEFRISYPEGNDWNRPASGHYTEAMKAYLGDMVNQGKVVLYKNSYTIHTTSADKGNDLYVTAIPIDIYGEQYVVCNSNIEIKWHVGGESPAMTHGFKELTYPQGLDEKSVRIGLAQLRQASSLKSNMATSYLTIPVNLVKPVSEGVTDLRSDASDPYLYLIDTNDPEYADLSDVYGGEGLIEVGMVQDITAKAMGTANLMSVSFFSEFKFKEGYYYRLKFRFAEDRGVDEPVEDPDAPLLCSGELSFCVKVVPEYQMWVGSADDAGGGAATNRNWDNDANWARVSSDDLYRAVLTTSNYTTDGSNPNPAAGFAPMDFTKVIIPSGVSYPHLYSVPSTTDNFFNGDGTGTHRFAMSDIASVEAPLAAGSATDGVQYDMCVYAGTTHYYCRPWRAAICKEIDFRPASEIFGQQWLDYDRAWVEMALAPKRWHTLASPLQAVVAGDMYLPTATSRQQTELFQPITFSTSTNNRFDPAVYQRSWDKAVANVMTLDHTTENVAIRTTWSHVFNDVTVWYQGGTGYSIKVDSDVEEALMRLPKSDAHYYYYSEGSTTGGDQQTNVHSGKGTAYKLNDVSKAFSVTISGANSSCRYFLVGNPFMAHMDMAKFLEVNSGAIAPKYWAMTADSQRAAIMSTAGHLVGVAVGGADSDYGGDGESLGLLSPMQGFFVEALTPGTALTVQFTPEMMAVASELAASYPLLAPSRSEGVDAAAGVAADAASAMLQITAIANGVAASRAAIRPDAAASASYEAAEDVAMLYDPDCQDAPMVYTIAGTVATSVNALPADVASIPLGVATPGNGSAATLRFDGVDALPGAMLYDAQADAYFDLYDGFEYTVGGSSSGRLFIATADCTATPALAEAITFSVTGNELTVASVAGSRLEVSICDALGRTVASLDAPDGMAAVALNPGIYIARASTDGGAAASAKLVIP